MSNIVRLGRASEIPPGTGKVVDAAGRSLAVFNVDGTFCAIDNACTHRGGPLGEGDLDGEVVTCPLHGARFNVKTGEVLGPPASERARSFSVQLREGEELVLELD